ncbi:MAG: hypothetical protein C0621_09090 [Desulfuromonas sp.]|nr:MAG: hypothetical protein C0621_09090 [Desulfuromonas sp.]
MRMLQETPQEYDDRFLNAVTRAFDPHSNYMPPMQKEDFDISMRGSLEGIGATLREEDGYIKVVEIIPGSAAARQGELEAEDVILKVAEGEAEPVDVTDSRLRDAVSLIRGKKGTEVRLTVKKHDTSIRIIPIVRDVVQIEETFVKSAILDDPEGPSFGYLRIPSFYRDFQASTSEGGRNCSDDVRDELKALKEAKVAGIVIDLRNNGGGALTDAVNIAGFFIPSGPVVQIKDGRGRLRELDDEDAAVLYNGPLVVLVNQFSASASEILAGALQDYGRAVIVGSEHTHGKGTVQALLDLDRSLRLPGMDKYRPLGALKVTIQKFYRVSGGSTQYRGVTPDIILPDRLAHLESGEKYLDYSLPWDTVAPSDYRRRDHVTAFLPRLQGRSRQRIAADEKWQELQEEAKLARQRSEQTRLSLHIDEVRKEREQVKALAADGHSEGHPEDGEAENGGDKKTWQDELDEDLYAQESLAVLRDILAEKAVTVSTGSGGPYSRGN